MADLKQFHPITFEPILRFTEPVRKVLNPVHVQVDSMDINQEKKFIQNFSKKLYSKNVCYEHTWEKNDILFADNFYLLHGRNAFKKFSPRFLKRIQIL